jgi:anti-sigma B factor antagonist
MLSLTIQNLNDVAVFHCIGRITIEDEHRLRRAVLSQSPIRMAVLDLAEVSGIDAAGVGMLMALRAWANETGARLKLMNLTPLVEETLQVTNLRSAFEICSVPEMIDLLCRASRMHQAQAAAGMAAA